MHVQHRRANRGNDLLDFWVYPDGNQFCAKTGYNRCIADPTVQAAFADTADQAADILAPGSWIIAEGEQTVEEFWKEPL